MSAKSHFYQLDKVAAYAAALDADISAERFQEVENKELKTYFRGTLYGVQVAAGDVHKFDNFQDARANAELFRQQCKDILSKRGAV